ncbi:DMT family transporter [Oryzibacter oryziterrae]|uniref:DMT family transporter n=1 Tax=Oryzibacter oryziterrae TaxID=2766474 RepID=UPI001F4319D8|nr:DMT family transporter [Oryzibacter oryziterrae]
MRGVLVSFRHELMIVSATLLAAFGWFFSLNSLSEMPPMLFVGVRFLTAGIIVGVVGRVNLRELGIRQPWTLVPGLCIGLGMAFWVLALARATNLGVGSFIGGLGNLLAPIVGLILFRWPVNRATWMALAVAAVGMGFLFLHQDAKPQPADWLFLASAVGFSLNFVINTHLTSARSPVLLTSVQLVTAGVCNLVFSALLETWPTHIPSWPVISWMTASIVLATSMRFFIQIKGQSGIPVSRSALIMCLEPVWTTAIAALWLGTRMNPSQMIGCGLIFCALVLRSLSADRRQAASQSSLQNG